MPTMFKVLLASIFVLAATYQIQAANSDQQYLKCWYCGSDTNGSEDFCGVNFDEDKIPDAVRERNWAVERYCNTTIHSDQERAVCRKVVDQINGKTVTKRLCYYTNKLDAADYCMNDAVDNGVVRTFCEDCWTDKCNGAGRFTAFLALFSVPTLIASAKLF